MMSAATPVTFASFSVWMSPQHSPVFVQMAMIYLEHDSAKVKVSHTEKYFFEKKLDTFLFLRAKVLLVLVSH